MIYFEYRLFSFTVSTLTTPQTPILSLLKFFGLLFWLQGWMNELLWILSLSLFFRRPPCPLLSLSNRRSSEIQGTALSKCLRAWTCIYGSMPVAVVQSRNAFVGGTVRTWGRWWIPVNKRQRRHQKCWSSTHCSWGTCTLDIRFPQLVV